MFCSLPEGEAARVRARGSLSLLRGLGLGGFLVNTPGNPGNETRDKAPSDNHEPQIISISYLSCSGRK